MPKRLRKESDRDLNEVAFDVVRKATEEHEEPEPTAADVSRIMAAMGRKGGLKGGKRRLETMTAFERREAASKAAKARWAKPKRRRKP